MTTSSRPGTMRPDAAYIDALITEGQTRYQAYHAKCDRIDLLVAREHEVYIPEPYQSTTKAVRVPILADLLRRVNALLTEGYPTAEQTPVEEGPKAEERADKVEEWVNAALPRLEKQVGRPVFRNLVANAGKHGLGVLWCEWAPQAWDDYDSAVNDEQPRQVKDQRGKARPETKHERKRRLELMKRRQPLPWHLTDVDPRAVFFFPDWQGMRDVVLGFKRQRAEVADRFGLTVGTDGRLKRRVRLTAEGELAPGTLGEGWPIGGAAMPTTNWGTVDFYVHYNRRFTTYYADGFVVEQYEHGYHRPPVFEAPGLSDPSVDPAKKYLSLVDPLLELIEALDEMLTIARNVGIIGGYPMGQVEEPEGAPPALNDVGPDPEGDGESGESRESAAIEYAPGEFKRTAPGVKLRWVEQPEISQTLKYIVDLYLQIIRETGALPPIVKGYAQGSDQPGYAVAQLNQAARSMFEPVLGNIGVAYEEAAEYMLWCIEEKIQDPVYVLGADPSDPDREAKAYVGLGPADIRGHYDVSIQIKAVRPMRDAAMLRVGVGLWKDQAIDHGTFLSEFGNWPNPRKIIRKVRRERFVQSEPVTGWIIEETMRRLKMRSTPEPAPALPPGQDPSAMPPGGPGLPPLGPPPMPATAGLSMAGGVEGMPTLPGTTEAPGGMPGGDFGGA